jgi:hypothetical protein
MVGWIDEHAPVHRGRASTQRQGHVPGALQILDSEVLVELLRCRAGSLLRRSTIRCIVSRKSPPLNATKSSDSKKGWDG